MGRAVKGNSLFNEFAVSAPGSQLRTDRPRSEISPVHARQIPTFISPSCLDLSHACKAGKAFPQVHPSIREFSVPLPAIGIWLGQSYMRQHAVSEFVRHGIGAGRMVIESWDDRKDRRTRVSRQGHVAEVNLVER